jgi:hypothetical protein
LNVTSVVFVVIGTIISIYGAYKVRKMYLNYGSKEMMGFLLDCDTYLYLLVLYLGIYIALMVLKMLLLLNYALFIFGILLVIHGFLRVRKHWLDTRQANNKVDLVLLLFAAIYSIGEASVGMFILYNFVNK